jgi:hypothetical protein
MFSGFTSFAQILPGISHTARTAIDHSSHISVSQRDHSATQGLKNSAKETRKRTAASASRLNEKRKKSTDRTRQKSAELLKNVGTTDQNMQAGLASEHHATLKVENEWLGEKGANFQTNLKGEADASQTSGEKEVITANGKELLRQKKAAAKKKTASIKDKTKNTSKKILKNSENQSGEPDPDTEADLRIRNENAASVNRQ